MQTMLTILRFLQINLSKSEAAVRSTELCINADKTGTLTHLLKASLTPVKGSVICYGQNIGQLEIWYFW